MNLAEYIKGFLGIIAIIFFGIGIVVWKFRAADEIQEIEKKIDVDTKKVIESDLKILSDVSFPDEIDVRKMYGVISAGGIQEIECIKVYEGKYFVKMKFYGEGYFILKGNHVDIVSVGRRRSGRRPAESPVCRAGRNERKRHTENPENRQSH